MLVLILYLLLIFSLLLFLIFMSVYTLSLIYSSVKGSPYVATRKKRIEEILEEADLKKGKLFIELGSGDGRIVRTAVKKYGVRGIGIDINPLLIFWARILTLLSFRPSERSERVEKSLKDSSTSLGMTNLTFRIENIFDTNLTKADYVYIFLMPKLIEELAKKMKIELKKGAIVISHGFPIKGWEKKLYKKIEKLPFPTYYYRK